jgi:transposase
MDTEDYSHLMNKKPASTVLARFKSNRDLARKLGISPSTITRWTYPKIMKGTDGHIPQKYWIEIIHIARREGFTLTIEHLSGLRA